MPDSERKGLVGGEDGYEQGADPVRGDVLHERELELATPAGFSNAKIADLDDGL